MMGQSIYLAGEKARNLEYEAVNYDSCSFML